TFLALSYFGTDQSQVQRYLTGRSVRESQLGLIMNGFLKIPMQFFILLVGVMVFVFYQFNASPLNFNPVASQAVIDSEYGQEYQELENALQENFESKKSLALTYGLASNAERKSLKEEIILADAREKELRSNARKIIDKIELKVESNDKDYVFIHFILNHLPRGVIGLLLAMALSAAMSSTASELNALSTTTTMDLYKRGRGGKSDRHYLMASKWFTLLWGVLAILFASIASLFDNLIQLVNIIGSIFYGNILGVFLLAFFFRFVRSNAVF